MPLTPNQASLIGALGGAALGAAMGGVVSFLIAKYVIRHGPNYEDKIQSVYEVLASLAKTQEALREQHERFAITERNQLKLEQKKAAAILWKPKAESLRRSRETSRSTN